MCHIKDLPTPKNNAALSIVYHSKFLHLKSLVQILFGLIPITGILLFIALELIYESLILIRNEWLFLKEHEDDYSDRLYYINHVYLVKMTWADPLPPRASLHCQPWFTAAAC